MKLLKKKIHKEHDTSDQVVAYQQKTLKAAEEMKKANKKLAETLEKNHVTVRIYSGIAGRPRRAKA